MQFGRVGRHSFDCEVSVGAPLSLSSLHVDLDDVTKALGTAFSWAVVPALAVVYSGKFLAKAVGVSIPGSDKDYFYVPIWPVLNAGAAGSQVGYGIAAYLLTFALVGGLLGRSIYTLVRVQFGIDPGQWASISIASSILTLLWTFLSFLLQEFVKRTPEKNAERDDIIVRLAQGHDS